MSLPRQLICLLLPCWLLAGTALAAGAEVTITVISDEHGSPSAVSNVIALPDRARQKARESSRAGMDAANRAREAKQTLSTEAASANRLRGELIPSLDGTLPKQPDTLPLPLPTLPPLLDKPSLPSTPLTPEVPLLPKTPELLGS